MAHTVRISVLGMDLRLQTDDDEAFVQRVAAAVNDRASRMKQKGAPQQQLAVFAALQLAEELMRERDAAVALRAHLAQELRGLAAEVRRATAVSGAEDA